MEKLLVVPMRIQFPEFVRNSIVLPKHERVHDSKSGLMIVAFVAGHKTGMRRQRTTILFLTSLRKTHVIEGAHVGEVHQAFVKEPKVVRLAKRRAVQGGAVDVGGDLKKKKV